MKNPAGGARGGGGVRGDRDFFPLRCQDERGGVVFTSQTTWSHGLADIVHVPVFGRVESESEGGGAWLKRGHQFHFCIQCSFYFIPFSSVLDKGSIDLKVLANAK